MKKLENTAIITSVSSITSHYVYDSFQKTIDGEETNFETLRIKELNIKKTVNGTETSLMKFVYSYHDNGHISQIDRYEDGFLTTMEWFLYDIYDQIYLYDNISCDPVTQEFSEILIYYEIDLRGNMKKISSSFYKEGYDMVYRDIDLTYETSGWIDQLVAVHITETGKEDKYYTVGGYDSIGNPSLYMGYEVNYQQRSITSLTDPRSGDSMNFKYNANGIRTYKKDFSGITTDYILEGTKIIKEIRSDGKVLQYFYDASDSIIGFSYNSTFYSYIKNLQNDIVAIADSNGNLIVKYAYDAYGNVIDIIDSSGIGLGTINPFRFKSYYYDVETNSTI